MNPQRLAKGNGGGVFSRMVIRGTSQDTLNVPTQKQDFSKQVSAEIVRI